VSDFLIDARFLFHNATESFWEHRSFSPTAVTTRFASDSCATSCAFAKRCTSMLGRLSSEAYASSVAAENDIHAVVAQCGDLGIVVIEERGSRA